MTQGRSSISIICSLHNYNCHALQFISLWKYGHTHLHLVYREIPDSSSVFYPQKKPLMCVLFGQVVKMSHHQRQGLFLQTPRTMQLRGYLCCFIDLFFSS